MKLSQAGEDTGNMLKSTCTTFLKTLEECMQIANHSFTSELTTQSPPGSPPVAAVKPLKVRPPKPTQRQRIHLADVFIQHTLLTKETHRQWNVCLYNSMKFNVVIPTEG